MSILRAPCPALLRRAAACLLEEEEEEDDDNLLLSFSFFFVLDDDDHAGLLGLLLSFSFSFSFSFLLRLNELLEPFGEEEENVLFLVVDMLRVVALLPPPLRLPLRLPLQLRLRQQLLPPPLSLLLMGLWRPMKNQLENQVTSSWAWT